MRSIHSRLICWLAPGLLLLVSACNGVAQTPATAPVSTGQPALTVQPSGATETPFQVATPSLSPTPEPLALRVNGEGISLAEYQAELVQLQSALEARQKTLAPDAQRQKALDHLVESALLAQGAVESGFTLDETALQAEIDRLAGQLGSPAALADWQVRNGYSEAAFRAALRRSMAAAWQRDQIIATVPTEAEQVHARQILTLDEAAAQRALQQVLVPGVNFATYAFRYDPLIGGDLGWFPRGYLTQPEVEAAAFALQPGQISEVIQSQIGYHVVQVIAREQRPLSPDARLALQRAALRDWLAEKRAASAIELLIE